MTPEQLFEVMREVDPETKRVPPGFVALANAIERNIRKELSAPREKPTAWMATAGNVRSLNFSKPVDMENVTITPLYE